MRLNHREESVEVKLFGPQGSSQYRYDFGDGTVIDTNATFLRHEYAAGGNYAVVVQLLNARCGNRTVIDTLREIPAFASVQVDTKDASGCAPFTLVLRDESVGTFESHLWQFPGAEPATSTFANPTVVYPNPGNYLASLTLVGGIGPDTFLTFPVIVSPTPDLEFSFTQDTATVTFRAESGVATAFFWDFGDGNTSEEPNPVHTYAAPGTYQVSVTALLGPCSTRLEREVVIDRLSPVRDLAARGVRVFPNPTTGWLRVSGPATIIDAFDLQGRRIHLPAGARELDLSHYPAGTYLLRLLVGADVDAVRIIKSKDR